MNIIQKSGSYHLRYKSVESDKNDKVIVDYGSYRDSVIFKDKYGVKLKVVDGNILTFTGVSQSDTNYIYAYRGDKKIGKLFLNTYKPQTKYIELVSVNRAKIDKSITAEGLNQIFKGAVVNFKIEIKSLDIRDLKTFTHGGSNWHSVYNDDQKKVLEAYDSQMKDDKFYLFFVDNVLDKKDSLGTSVSGYMPRGYNCGFIYDGGSEHTIAHELGHGIAGLEHVFSDSKSSGNTANLMDYSSGEELWHFQWDQIQDPSRVWMKWNKAEEEGENLKININDKDDLKKFYLIVSELKHTSFFNIIYNISEKTDTYYDVRDMKVTIQNINSLKQNSNGQFVRAENDTLFDIWIFSYIRRAGEEDNPHRIELFSSKNTHLSKNHKGNAFASGSTIFEEFFHAAHFEYLKSISKYNKNTQHTQTETEVEFAQAFIYYLMTLNKDTYKNSFSNAFDGYNILDNFTNYQLISVFQKINKKQTLSDDDKIIIKDTMHEILKRKKNDYKSLDINSLDNSCDFLYYLIKESRK